MPSWIYVYTPPPVAVSHLTPCVCDVWSSYRVRLFRFLEYPKPPPIYIHCSRTFLGFIAFDVQTPFVGCLHSLTGFYQKSLRDDFLSNK